MQSAGKHGIRIGITTLLVIFSAVFAASLFTRASNEPPEIGPVHCVLFCPNGQNIVTANQDGTVRLWDISSGDELQCYHSDQTCAVTAVAVSADGTHVLATQNHIQPEQNGMVMLNLKTGKVMQRFLGHAGAVNAVAFCPDNIHVVSGSSDHTVRVWNITNGQEVQCLRGHEADVNALCVSADGQFIVSASGDYWGGVLNDPSIRIWNVKTGNCLRTLKKLSGAVYGLSLSADGQRIASCGWDGFIRIWDFPTGNELHQFGGGNEHYHSVLFSPDGRYVLSGSGHIGGNVQLWETKTGKEIRRFKGNYSQPNSIAIASDGKSAASAHGYYGSRKARRFNLLSDIEGCVVDGIVRVWNIESGEQVQTIGQCSECLPISEKR